MEYLCLVYVDENRLASLPRDERDTLLARTCGYRRDLLARHHYLWARWLPPARLATTVRRGDGSIRLRDSAAVPGDEQLGLVVLLRADDLDQALKLAAELPLVGLGCVEVRPLGESAPWGRQEGDQGRDAFAG